MSTTQDLRRHALRIWNAGVAAVDAGLLVRRSLRVRAGALEAGPHRYPLTGVRRILVVGGGKAGAAMAAAVEDVLGEELLVAHGVAGWINVPDREVVPLRAVTLHGARSGYENQPTEAGVEGCRRILDLLAGVGPNDLVLCLISGGGSALLPAPAGDVTLEDVRTVTRLLHGSGATITEMNTVRKHVSNIKGGGLARAAGRARTLSLIVSDVVGDPLDVIASGPTAPDPTTYADAWAVLENHRIKSRTPNRLKRHLREGAAGRYPETPKRPGSRVRNLVIGNNGTAVEAAAREARALGYRVVNLYSFVEGESREVGVALAGMARGARHQDMKPVCILSGGETTVSLETPPPGSPAYSGSRRSVGLGGRNQELVLGALHHLWDDGMRGIALLSGGTDGEDGPTDAAGAVADATVVRAARRRGLDPGEHLARHDAYRFFDTAGGLIRTGPTRTNVMDLRVVLVG